MEITAVTAEDLPEIREIYNRAIATSVAIMHYEPRSEKQIEEWMLNRSDRYPVLAARSEGELVGFATLSQWSPLVGYDDTAELSLYVKEGKQGMGIGRKLMDQILLKGKENHLYTVFSRITDGNSSSIALHEKFGFALAGTLKELGFKFGQRVDIHYYQKML